MSKLGKLALVMALSFAVACGVASDDRDTEDLATETSETSAEIQVPAELTPTSPTTLSACSSAGGVCDTAFNCHHLEGTNINKAGCATGKICCRY